MTGDYEGWNRAVVDIFFDGRYAHRPVYLDLEPEILEEAARVAGIKPDEALDSLTTSVAKTLHLVGFGPIFARHTRRTREWISEGRDGAPPFLALLAFLSSIAEEMRSDASYAANNYYGRLCQRLGLNPEGPDRDRVARWFRAETPLFWSELNGWLDTNDGRLGTPTAYALDPHLKYVGVPISQAIVRERDRRVLQELFAQYRLTPGSRLSRSDMLRFLEDWMPHAPVSTALRALFRQPAARERVADVACIELELWDGVVAAGQEASQAREATISLVAAIHRHPRPRVWFDFVVRSVAPLVEGPYRLAEDASTHAVAALAETDGILTVGQLEPEGWRSLSESASVSVPDFLLANIRLIQGDASIRHEPRSVVILERDEELMRYVEVPRAHLTREYFLLTRERLREPLEELLASSARPGYRVASAAELGGLPEGWVAVTGVELIALPETSVLDFAPLIPVSWSAISLLSGFSLPSRATWLRGALPEVVATSLDKAIMLVVSLTGEHLLDHGAEPPPRRELSRFSRHVVVDLADLDLAEGDYRVAISTPGEDAVAIASAALRVRSASTPKVLSAGQRGAIGYAFDGPASRSLGARELNGIDQDDLPVVVGAWSSNGHGLSGAAITIPSELGVTVEPTPDEEADELGSVEARGGEAPSCIETGAHYIVLPEAGRGRPASGTTIEGTCKLCGLEQWYPARPGASRRTRNAPRRARGSARAAPARAVRSLIIDVPAIAQEERGDVDQLMDGLSYAQRGRWNTFDALASQVVDSTLFAYESAWLLSSLAHVDLILDRRMVRPEGWAVCPPVLVLPEDGSEAFLCGQRSRALLDRLRDGAAALGGALLVEGLSNAPARVTVRGLRMEDLGELADDAKEALGVEMRVAEGAATRIAALLPPISAILNELSTFTRPVEASLERFDVPSGKWVNVLLVDRAGAYRSRGYLTRYGFAASVGAELRETDARLCKWLAASHEHRALLAYDESVQALVCPLGAEPPGLFERALVMCSGRPPEKRRDGTTLYTRVPPNIASTLWRRLTS